MNTEPEQKPKMSRAELLAKARQAKADKARAKEAAEKVKELEVKIEEPVVFKPKAKSKPKAAVEVKTLETTKKELEPEIIEEVVRVPANRRKKVVKRTIEIEESETDEEVIEEVVRIPKMKKEVKISRDEMKKKLLENNKQRLHNELFS
jgi:hypothetical protein